MEKKGRISTKSNMCSISIIWWKCLETHLRLFMFLSTHINTSILFFLKLFKILFFAPKEHVFITDWRSYGIAHSSMHDMKNKYLPPQPIFTLLFNKFMCLKKKKKRMTSTSSFHLTLVYQCSVQMIWEVHLTMILCLITRYLKAKGKQQPLKTDLPMDSIHWVLMMK